MARKYVAEPFRIKMVEPIKMLKREEREEKIRNARFNMFNLAGEDCYIDMLTDSGTNAMSDKMWSGIMMGDEAYAGSRSSIRLVKAGQDIFNYSYIQPVHQGRAAEKVLFGNVLGPGKYSISNMFFDTTRAHVEIAGARAIDCVVPEARDPKVKADFKGNMDVAKLEELIKELGPEKVPMVVMTITNNSAGGQPVSIQNMRDTAAVCKKYGILLNIDAARFSENAFFIKQREEEFKNSSILEITREMFSYADTFTMSAKKDGLANMGGLIGIKDENSPLILPVKASCISFEGFTSYGGLTGRDMEALAIGLYEGMDEDYLRYRIGQSEYIAAGLDEVGIAYQSPVGGHGIFIDAADLLPHIPYYEFPAHTLAVELYKEAGIRTCDIGSYMLGNDPDTGEQLKSQFEFTRFAIPRRVYTQAHLDIIVEALTEIKKRADSISGYRITWEPPILRHFQAHLVPLKEG